MANQYVHLSEPLSQEEVPTRRLGKTHVLVGFLIGMGCGCVWALSQEGQQQLTDPTNAMAMKLTHAQAQQSRTLQPRNFLKTMVKVQPPALEDKLGMKAESSIAKPLIVAGGILSGPFAAHAAMTPSLQNLLNSVVAGGFVLGAIVAAVVTVANFDPVDRA
jgi:hypothetical protein